jgi:hypothetical protein
MQLLNNEHFLFLEPLSDWRILDLKGLIELSQVERYKGYEVVKKLTHRLRSRKIIETYQDPWTRKNYIYLSSTGEKLICPDSPSKLKNETLYHDSKVSEICMELLKLDSIVTGIELEHKIKVQNKMSSFDEVLPDARLSGNFRGEVFQAAIEIELNQKEKSRIVSKAKNYFKSTYYDHAFYFFPDEKILKNYDRILKEGVDINYNQKIFLFNCPLIFKGKSSLAEGSGLALNKRQSLFELFELFPMTSH